MINFDEVFTAKKIEQSWHRINAQQIFSKGKGEIRMSISFTQMLPKQMFLNYQARAIWSTTLRK